MIKPTVGRVVLYWPAANLGGRNDQPLAATVSFVHSDRLINIGYLTPDGEHRNATSVMLLQEEDTFTVPGSSGYCEWMPYQKGQAAKTEAAEAATNARLPTLLAGDALDKAIADRPYPKVTKLDIEQDIDTVDYFAVPNAPTVTMCSIKMKNGYSVRGESACVDPRNYDETIGRSIAYKNAFDKLWALEGYLLASTLAMANDLKP